MSSWLYLIYVLVAVLGRILGQSLSARKELANQNRRYRLERLADAWRSIQLAASDTSAASRRGLEGALRDVELFGTPSQVERAATAVRALDAGSDRGLVVADLLEALRTELRQEMHLSRRVAPLAPVLGEPPARSGATAAARVVVGLGRCRASSSRATVGAVG